ncbi:MAG TPA: hypothetical protein ENN40_11420 [Candidatus Aminicenantes bacterium]|nr:hypothetical protein [Candidatus Aminicenantes bacterium]
MTPILRSKQKRDTVLFWGMFALTLAFLLYLFLPGSRSQENHSVPAHPAGDVPGAIESGDEGNYGDRLATLLEKGFQESLRDSTSLETDPAAALTRHLNQVEQLGRTQSGREALRSWLQRSRDIGMFELGDPRVLAVPEFVSKENVFRLYLALFMLKLEHSDGLNQLRETSIERLLTILSAPIFSTVDWEIHSDAEAFPALTVFRIWLERTDIYPYAHPGLELVRHLDRFRDLSPGRWITRLRQWADFSCQVRTFVVEWVEDDGIWGKDRGVYADLRQPVYRFLGQEYSIIPETTSGSLPKWLNELVASDAGDIELISFRMATTETQRSILSPRCIWYNPLGNRFVVVFSTWEAEANHPHSPLQQWIRDRCDVYHRAFHRLSIADNEINQSADQRRNLLRFGRFLKRLGQP